MTVKLSGSLPGGDRSGLDLIQGELVRQPANAHYVIAMIDCSKTTVEHGTDGETYTPTAKILYVEPVRDEMAIEIVKEMLSTIRAERVGNGTIAFDLGLADLRATEASGGGETS